MNKILIGFMLALTVVATASAITYTTGDQVVFKACQTPGTKGVVLSVREGRFGTLITVRTENNKIVTVTEACLVEEEPSLFPPNFFTMFLNGTDKYTCTRD